MNIDNADAYIIVKCKNIIELIETVNRKSSQGLIPHGNLVIDCGIFYQPMMLTRRYANQIKDSHFEDYIETCKDLRREFKDLSIGQEEIEKFSNVVSKTQTSKGSSLVIDDHVVCLSQLHRILNIGELLD